MELMSHNHFKNIKINDILFVNLKKKNIKNIEF